MIGLQFRDLRYAYNGSFVLDGVSSRLEAGEWLVVIGPNGAGKTTLVRALGGTLRVDGEVRIGSQLVSDMGRRDRARSISVVPQTPTIPAGITVFDYVLLGRTPHIPYFSMESRLDVERVLGVLGQLELDPFAGRPLAALSGGERQRVILARALAQDAQVLLLDEPTTALDLGHQQQVLALVDRLRRERDLTVVSTMHDLTLAGQYGDRLLLMDDGRPIAEGDPNLVLREDLIGKHFGAAISVLPGRGGPIVVPTRN